MGGTLHDAQMPLGRSGTELTAMLAAGYQFAPVAAARLSLSRTITDAVIVGPGGEKSAKPPVPVDEVGRRGRVIGLRDVEPA